MKKKTINKGLVIFIVFSLVFITIPPNIYILSAKKSIESDQNIIITHVCGVEGFDTTSVNLTRQQSQNLNQYFITLRARLNQTTSKVATATLLREAIVELNKYQLLPKGMSIEQAQDIVTGQNRENTGNNIYRRITENWYYTGFNFFCYIVGHTTSNTFFISLPTRVLAIFTFFLLELLFDHLPSFLLDVLVFLLLGLPSIIGNLNPVAILHWICFGSRANPSRGWLFSIGLLGIKIWNYYLSSGFDDSIPYVGVVGFTGFKIYQDGNYTFLGTALLINLV